MSANEPPWTLLVDVCATRMVAALGHFHADRWHHMETSDATPVEGLHRLVHTTLQKQSISLTNITHLIVCHGPGNTLGLRSVGTLVAVRSTFSSNQDVRLQLLLYDSLSIPANLMHAKGTPGTLLCAGRRGTWYYRTLDAHGLESKDPRATDDSGTDKLPQPLWQITQRRGREPELSGAKAIEPPLPPSPRFFSDQQLLTAAQSFEPFDPVQAEYKKWQQPPGLAVPPTRHAKSHHTGNP